MAITNEQLAEVLAGIARTHMALLNATLPPEKVNREIVPLLRDTLGGIGAKQPLTLLNLYPRMLVQSLGVPRPGSTPLHHYYGAELDKLIAKA